MNDSKKEQEDNRVSTPEERAELLETKRRIRAIMPLGMRVVIKIRREVSMTESGLYLPEGSKEARQESLLGEVIEVASAVDDDTDEETNISGVPKGALVLICKHVGITVPWDDELRIVETKDVLAIVEETDLN